MQRVRLHSAGIRFANGNGPEAIAKRDGVGGTVLHRLWGELISQQGKRKTSPLVDLGGLWADVLCFRTPMWTPLPACRPAARKTL
jgi:hypothetical protein